MPHVKGPGDKVWALFSERGEYHTNFGSHPGLNPRNPGNILHHFLQTDLPQFQIHQLGISQIRTDHKGDSFFIRLGVVLPTEGVKGPANGVHVCTREVDRGNDGFLKFIFEGKSWGGRHGRGGGRIDRGSACFGINIVPFLPNQPSLLKVRDLSRLLRHQGSFLVNLFNSAYGLLVKGVRLQHRFVLCFR